MMRKMENTVFLNFQECCITNLNHIGLFYHGKLRKIPTNHVGDIIRPKRGCCCWTKQASKQAIMNILEPISDRSASEEWPIAARDEVKEIENQNKKETRRVRTWRLIVTFILTATGISVSSSSYLALLKQEEQNFEDAVRVSRDA